MYDSRTMCTYARVVCGNKKKGITNVVHVYCFNVVSYEPRQEKICLRGLRPGQTQTPCTAIEASWKLEFGLKERTCTFGHAP